MTTDITLMGPHALAAHHAHILALQSFGIDPVALSLYEDRDRSLAKQFHDKQSLIVQEKDETASS